MFRGNVQTRLAKLESGVAEATLLANAGLIRLGLADRAVGVLDTENFLPAPGQGAICIETRSDDRKIVELVQAINDEQTELALVAERAFLKALDGSCRTPIAGLAEVDGSKISFSGMVLSEDGNEVFETSDTCEANVQAARKMGKKAGDFLRQQAGADFFHHWS